MQAQKNAPCVILPKNIDRFKKNKNDSSRDRQVPHEEINEHEDREQTDKETYNDFGLTKKEIYEMER